jgi:uncharacterized membrane protein YidH (DUF202 family)
MTTSARTAAIISFLLALPGELLFTLLILHVEPDFGPLEPLLTDPDPDKPDVVGSLIVLVAMLLMPFALIINLRVIHRARRAGQSLMAYPVNLLLAVAIVAYIASFIGGIIIDQYPCWVGVPNCD